MKENVIDLFDHFVVPSYKRNLVMQKGEGSKIWDESGKEYLDMGGGIAVNCLGHCHPRIRKALEQQGGELIHLSNLYYHKNQGELAQRLVKLTGAGKMFFCNSGAEANELLYKLARKVGGEREREKYEVITTLNSFHGRTLAGISASGQDKLRVGFGPVTPGFKHVPYNDLQAMEEAVTEKTAAILIEGIQGEGGINPATADYLVGLRKLANEKDILLLWDGVQCGHFRTGSFQSYERILEEREKRGEREGRESFLPDAIAMAKSLGGGFPMGAVWIREKWADLLQPGSHGTTYGGSPLASAVAMAVLDEIEEKNLAENIRKRGEELKQKLEAMIGKSSIREVRGLGGMLGIVLEEERQALTVVQELAEKGLLVVPAAGNVVRFLPPLNVKEEEIDQAVCLAKEVL